MHMQPVIHVFLGHVYSGAQVPGTKIVEKLTSNWMN